MPRENIQSNETTVDEINVDGGWLVTHHTLTQTWDTRVRLDSVPDQVEAKRVALEQAQQEYDAEVTRSTAFQKEIADAKVEQSLIEAMPRTVTATTTEAIAP